MTEVNLRNFAEREVDNGILVNEGERFIFKPKSTAMGLTIENKRGSNCSLSDGAQSRVLVLGNITTSNNEQVYVNGLILHSADYTINNLSSSSTITFINSIWDDMYIKIVYYQA
jgi:hypothetical protein